MHSCIQLCEVSATACAYCLRCQRQLHSFVLSVKKKKEQQIQGTALHLHSSTDFFFRTGVVFANWETLQSLICFLAPSTLPVIDNEGIFELTQCPLLPRAVSFSYVETTENPVVVR